MKGIKVEEQTDIQIDLDVTCYIPDEYISDSNQKIEIYQDIALCKNENDIQNVIDEIIDRFGNMPKELENLISIARIKYLAKEQNMIKIFSNKNKIVFTYEQKGFNENVKIEKILKKYGNRIKFSPGVKPTITLSAEKNNENEIINETIGFLKENLNLKEVKDAKNI